LLKKDKEIFRKNLFNLNKFKYNALHQAANLPKANKHELLEVLIDAVKEVFGEEGREMLKSLAKDESKFKNRYLDHQAVLRLIDEKFTRRTYLPTYDMRKAVSANDGSVPAKAFWSYERNRHFLPTVFRK
jgi:hypothetical protein